MNIAQETLDEIAKLNQAAENTKGALLNLYISTLDWLVEILHSLEMRKVIDQDVFHTLMTFANTQKQYLKFIKNWEPGV